MIFMLGVESISRSIFFDIASVDAAISIKFKYGYILVPSSINETRQPQKTKLRLCIKSSECIDITISKETKYGKNPKKSKGNMPILRLLPLLSLVLREALVLFSESEPHRSQISPSSKY